MFNIKIKFSANLYVLLYSENSARRFFDELLSLTRQFRHGLSNTNNNLF